MHFLPDTEVRCPICKGKRYRKEILEVQFRQKSIADVLELTIDEAIEIFSDIPSISEKLSVLREVGLGYLKLGQPATTLSGGEAQRVKLAKELSRNAKGSTLYLLDEPTTGLHLADIARLIHLLRRLVKAGHSVIVVEHNLELISCADWIIDLGPEDGENGGHLVAEGTLEEIKNCNASFTGQYLRKMSTN
jgi:excinuclease ABC subunit A